MRGQKFRYVIAAAGLLLCTWGIWSAGSAGLMRLLSRSARATHLLAPADRAVRLSAADPDAHFSRALVLLDLGRATESVKEFERAALLRPLDYAIWYQLAIARDQADDETGALVACEEALRLAPFYGRTHWLRGNLLFRAHRFEEALNELRLAAVSDPRYLPSLFDLAWNAKGGDASATEKTVAPDTRAWRLELARFFVKHEKYAEATQLYRAAGSLTEKERRTLTAELIAQSQYAAAYEVWAAGAGERDDKSNVEGMARMTDGGFEQRLDLDEQGFGWRPVKDTPSVYVSLDAAGPHTGTQSLRLDFNGNAAPTISLLKQLVLVEPNSRYRLTYAARTKEIVSGGLPLVALFDADVKEKSVPLAQDSPLPQSSNGWREYTFEFQTGAATRAIEISLQRQNCGGTLCPIFGSLWLDDFILQKL
jgi:tetratricopeptide (TPR) repeat protein